MSLNWDGDPLSWDSDGTTWDAAAVTGAATMALSGGMTDSVTATLRASGTIAVQANQALVDLPIHMMRVLA